MSLSDTLAEAIAARLPPPGERLPAFRQLAKELGTNKDSVARALEILARKGEIRHEKLRRGYFRTGSRQSFESPPDPEAAARGSRALERRICREILEGAYAGGDPLPPAKVLLGRLGGSRRALRDAMRSLEGSGILCRRGNWYVAAPETLHPRQGSAVYLAGSPKTLVPVRPGTQEFVVPLELELRRCGWGALRYFLTDSPSAATAPPRHEVAAFVAPRIAEAKRWAAYLNTCTSIPLVAFDAYETMHWGPARFPRHRSLFPLVLDNHWAGREVVRQAVSRGCRRIVFLAHLAPGIGPVNPWRRWLERRLEGMRDAAREAGAATFVERCLETDPTQGGSGLENPFSFPRISSPAIPAAARDLAFHAHEMVTRIHGIGVAMRPHFEQSLADDHPDVWICVNDQCAAAARQFLQHAGAENQVEIVSFDNSPLSYVLGISSYDFLVGQAALAAARCLVTPGIVRKDPDGYIRIRGRLISR